MGCATATIIPKLGVRPLYFHPKEGKLHFKYCKKYGFFTNKCKEWHVDYYDITDDVTRNRLRDLGYVCRPEK